MTHAAKQAAALLVAIAAHEALARALAAAGLVERLLSPSGPGAALALVAALALYGLRLGLLFVAPGLVAARIIAALIESRRAAALRGARAP
ncbi:MAG: hypothetical protein JWM10_3492 [Myxococcaceae bacterium]|nr:hypothetical protein [Myxococcaceae bacterium]